MSTEPTEPAVVKAQGVGVIAVVSGALLVISLLLSWWGLPEDLLDPPADAPGAVKVMAEAYADSGQTVAADGFEFFELRDLVWLVTGIVAFLFGLAVLLGLPAARMLGAAAGALDVVPHHVVHPGLLGGWGCLKPPAQGGHRMKLHANARTCPKSRRLIVNESNEEGWSLAAAAEAAGVSERTAAKWLSPLASAKARLACWTEARLRAGPTQLPADRVKAIEALRRLRMTAAEIAECLGMALSTVSRWLRRIGLGKRSRLEPPEPPNRYERKRPGRARSTSTSRSSGGSSGRGTAVTGHAKRHRSPRPLGINGWEFVHVCVDDATRLAYVEVLADESGETAAGFLGERSSGSKSMGITVERVMSDNGSCYRSKIHAETCRELGLPPAHPALSARAPTARPSDSSRRFAPLGLRSALRHLRRAHRRPARLAHPLQLHQTSWSPRPQGARSSARRAGTTS